jgi:hypothetical protein
MNTESQQHQEPDRVRRFTAPVVQQRIDQELEMSVNYYAQQPPEAVSQRIEELDHEWDMERVLGTNAAALALTGAFFGLVASRKWLLLTSGVLGFLMQHAMSGWCPPVPVFRRLGIRTRSEIDREKFALKVLRGDFKNLPQPEQGAEKPVDQALQSANA